MPTPNAAYWSQPPDTLFPQLDTTTQGLTTAQARQKLEALGIKSLKPHKRRAVLIAFLKQFKNPLILILIFSVCVSALVGEWVDASVVLAVIVGSTLLSFIQEYNATNAVEKLLARVEIKATVLRDGKSVQVPASSIVPGDVVLLSAGNLVPGDGVLLHSKNCYVDQAALTGETFPVEKKPGIVAQTASTAERSNCVFMGTSIRSGNASALIVHIGTQTAFGEIAQRLTLRPPETEFERGIRHFGYLLMQIILVLVLFVFAINVFAARPPVDSLLFAIALAVGIAPEMLPVIVTITLSAGAQRMAAKGVIVRRLNAIENFGNMDVLCVDKTGTLTEGNIRLKNACDAQGQPSDEILLYAYLNAHLQVGMHNPLDEALIVSGTTVAQQAAVYHLIDEIPYDFERKRLSVIVAALDDTRMMLTKGAYESIMTVCDRVMVDDAVVLLSDAYHQELDRRFADWSAQGFRVLGLAAKPVDPQVTFALSDETNLIFRGFLLFFDPPKADVQHTLTDLGELGVEFKIITGDNPLVAQYVAEQVGLRLTGVLSGTQLNTLRDEALWQLAERTNLFVEIDPNQKERIIRALQKTGHVVGYMGDGINDAPALHVADVGISVDQAVDVAKEAADFVLMEHSLNVLRDGIIIGRKTFANTLKYVFTTTSANFGNMFSMAGVSLFLPFLPMLAKQILLNNFLSDIPGIALASDNVDQEWIDKPHRWDVKLIRNFMIVFGLVSSVFDFLTFGVLLWVLQASPDEFRTGWFIESLMTELVIALIVRTRKPFFRSRPGRWLWWTTVAVAALTFLLPYLPVNTLFDFVPLPFTTLLLLIAITVLYVIATEIVKQRFYQWMMPVARKDTQ
ncbi:MAG: magnesium-translocating P-type ATPase [Chloroflexota bacterium]|nr:magnesium-translocating P-type ATPase [Chloroflexota bacterium]